MPKVLVTGMSGTEQGMVPALLDTLAGRGFAPGAVLDKGYDTEAIYGACEDRACARSSRWKMTIGVEDGWDKPPACDHGTWTFAGSDAKRGASKWRCPTGGCTPASRWVKAGRLHPLIPRETEKWKAMYRQRTAVERGFGRLKHEWAMLPLRVRRLPRVALHVDLTILAQLADALTRANLADAT